VLEFWSVLSCQLFIPDQTSTIPNPLTNSTSFCV
jgi:hypothetical protein